MADMVLDITRVPEVILSRIKTEKVNLHEENGSIILTPIADKGKSFDRLAGMFSDGKLSIDAYLKEKHLDKELEN